MPLPYPDPRVALATLHGKADPLGPPLAAIGLELVTIAVDTDVLGTFSGEVERKLGPRETVLAKARLGMQASGLPLGIATEASFGPDPVHGFLPWHHEVLGFVDEIHGQVLLLEESSHDTNWQSMAVADPAAAERLLVSSGFPEHALLVRPNQPREGQPVTKGLSDRDRVNQAIREMAACSGDGLARIETDMRAHMNPSRRRLLRRLGERLATRLASPCPSCGAPGFGLVRSLPGLPCSDCGIPTGLMRGEIHGCAACGHASEQARADGLSAADPGACPACNP